MDCETLKKLQNTELQILKEFDNYCRNCNIKYSLYAGTLLGAVRHGGFIPWDDDIDVAMTRSEYIKFYNSILQNPLSGYHFQNIITDSNCDISHGKLRKDKTLLLMNNEIENNLHHGIWLDIFPLDKISNDKKLSKRTKTTGIKICLLTRANQIYLNESLKHKIIKSLIRMIPSSIRRKWVLTLNSKLEKYNCMIQNNYYWASLSTVENINKYHFPENIENKYCTLKFENLDFLVFDNYKEVLKILFGNYMQLPPKNERNNTHNIKKIVM